MITNGQPREPQANTHEALRHVQQFDKVFESTCKVHKRIYRVGNNRLSIFDQNDFVVVEHNGKNWLNFQFRRRAQGQSHRSRG